ncbi:MAG: 2-amino-4-hydroxy-6-hydroxymethyldihydropteridine diphosphokinase [Phycisphaerales bacterium]|nr:2-amino-4-hydroxy-6-hydroxymethyldihydropteridine diphosphokinase [Phycisphaerales bacterium]
MVDDRGVFIALGSNLGDRERHLREALVELVAEGDIRVVACSGLHESPAVGGPPGQPPYLNAVAELATDLPPRVLLYRLQSIELQHGRQRQVRNGPRTLDLDLLLYRDLVVEEQDLQVPHPRMWQRRFVMEPLAEVCDLARLVAARRLRPLPTAQESLRDVHRHRSGAEVVA